MPAKIPVMPPSSQMSMVDMFHEHHYKNEEDDKPRYFIKELQHFVHKNNLSKCIHEFWWNSESFSVSQQDVKTNFGHHTTSTHKKLLLNILQPKKQLFAIMNTLWTWFAAGLSLS